MREVEERGAQLGTSVAVRSSATIEDGEAGARGRRVLVAARGPGGRGVATAIRAVWTSALTPLAAAYARRRAGRIAIGVIVQASSPGSGSSSTRGPPASRAGDDLIVQRGDRVAHLARSALPADIADQHAVFQALRAEHAIAVTTGAGAERASTPAGHAIAVTTGADVELVQRASDHGDVRVVETFVVQARPIVHPRPRALVPPPPLALAPLDDGRVWTWDVTHNPDPLSPAQTGLVERVEAAQLGGFALRVCAGYLYASPRLPGPGHVAPHVATSEPAPVVMPATAAELATRAAALEARIEMQLAASPVSVADAIERYLACYAIWAGELSPLVTTARRTSVARTTPRPSSVEATLAAAARGEIPIEEVERRLGALAPTWDVAVASFGERPGLLRDAIARARESFEVTHDGPRDVHDRAHGDRAHGDRAHGDRDGARAIADHAADLAAHGDHAHGDRAHGDRDGARAIADHAADLAERDDLLFARMQAMVRGALRVRAVELGLSSDDMFWLPLDEIARGTTIDPESARRRAAAARTAAERAGRWQMPIVVGASSPPTGPVLHGVGSGPRVVGRVTRFASLAAAAFAGPGEVVVVRAVTPALAVFVGRCAALVSETGGLLDHGAALARELGISCVVGCHGAWTYLDDGMLVAVDGDAGVITRLTDDGPNQPA